MKYTAAQIADLTGKTVQAVAHRARKEDWPCTKRPGKGGGRLFALSDLPEDVRLAIAAKQCPLIPAPITPELEEGLAATMRLTGKMKNRSEARATILALCQVFTARSGLAATPGKAAFVTRWNAGEIEAEAWLRDALPTVCLNSLRNWEKAVQTKGAARLGGSYGKHRVGTGIIESTPLMRESILGMLAEHPNTSTQLIREWLETKFSKVPSLRRLQAWVSAWKEANPGTWMYVQAPDAWRGKFMASCGSMYELVQRQNQRWEFDGTPSDIMLDDGKRYAIVGVINIYDRRLKLEVVPTSTARDVANLTRRAILDWGVPEEVITDNGKDFVAKYLQQVFVSLGILQTILPPFRPDLKPGIERAFRSFSHHLLTIAPCYVGHNVATRQAIRERETFAKRLFDRKNPQELSMAFSPVELQRFCDDWTDNTYAHRPHSGLNRRTPWEVSQSWIAPLQRIENERALDLLLTPTASNNGYREVGKKGLRCASGTYVAPELGGLTGQSVQVRMDPADLQWAYVFDGNGAFVCRAERTDGLSPEQMQIEAKAMRRVSQAKPKAESKELRSMAKLTDADQALPQIREHHRQKAETIRATAAEERSVTHTTPALEAAADAAKAHIPAVAMTEQSREVVPGFVPPATGQLRYQLYAALLAKPDRSELESTWMRHYGASSECLGFKEVYEMWAING